MKRGLLCARCDKVCPTDFDLQTHYAMIHGDEDRCDKCKNTFDDLASFEEHLKDCAFKGEEKKFKCKYPSCQTKWYSSFTAERHWAEYHKLHRKGNFEILPLNYFFSIT